ncbi:DUF2062 domain-containing protein [Pontivivens ytuae]|uniref:DUF2062 domain-containing protein n=1 Tax=Pontivivens ytuae TaxID=2789856 RepID=A0A7S9LSN9_9RHOB|nr:DUF2062 domain-containing protein [Pontivivens ytuae]QPH54431.1 DUF2062 domain-containing protein [Pontivivens ytuae]
MVFKRRKPLSTLERVRQGIYPKSGWRRAVEYLAHRLRRLPDSPHKVSLGLACGVFASFSPLFGLHFMAAMLCAWVVRGNLIASAIGTLFGNPITFPAIAYVSLGFGRWIMGDRGTTDFDIVVKAFANAFAGMWQTTKSFFGYGPSAWDRLALFFQDLFLPYLVGGIIPGLIAGTITYYVSRPVVRAYQARRREKLLKRIAKAARQGHATTAAAERLHEAGGG